MKKEHSHKYPHLPLVSIAISTQLWEIMPMLTWDQQLFYFLNSTISNPVFDWLMPMITDLHKVFWFQFVAAPLILLVWIYKKKWQVLPVFIGLILSVGTTDLITYRVLKPTFKRSRPPFVEKEIKLRTDRYAGFSFPSNHAANNFAGATFLSFCYPALSPVFFSFAGLVALSRVYVGVHYPLDIFVGSLLGVIFGLFFFKLSVIILSRISKGRWGPRGL